MAEAFLSNLRVAIRSVNVCRACADEIPELSLALDVARDVLRNIAEASLDYMVDLEQIAASHPVGDEPPPAALERLFAHAETIARQLRTEDARDALLDAARQISAYLGEGGLHRGHASNLLAKAAAEAGLDEAASRVWALETFALCEAP